MSDLPAYEATAGMCQSEVIALKKRRVDLAHEPLTRWDVSCPKCKAQPGQPCRRPNGDKMTNYYGGPAFHATRRGRVIPSEVTDA